MHNSLGDDVGTPAWLRLRLSWSLERTNPAKVNRWIGKLYNPSRRTMQTSAGPTLSQYRGTGVESHQCKPGAWVFQGWSVGAERLRFSPQPAASQRPTGSRCQQGGSALGNAVRLAWMCTFQALSVLLAAASVVPLMGTAANTTDTVYAGFTARTLCEGASYLFTHLPRSAWTSCHWLHTSMGIGSLQ